MTAFLLSTDKLTSKQLSIMSSALPTAKRELLSRLSHPVSIIESTSSAYLLFYAFIKGETDRGFVHVDIDTIISSAGDIADFSAGLGWPVGEHGKPFPNGASVGGNTLHAGITHSKGLICAAVSDRPVGIDLQQISNTGTNRMLRIAKRFHPDEYERLLSIPKSSLPLTFSRLWVCKESVVKLLGGNLSLLSEFCVDQNDCCRFNNDYIRISVTRLDKAYFAFAEKMI